MKIDTHTHTHLLIFYHPAFSVTIIKYASAVKCLYYVWQFSSTGETTDTVQNHGPEQPLINTCHCSRGAEQFIKTDKG